MLEFTAFIHAFIHLPFIHPSRRWPLQWFILVKTWGVVLQGSQPWQLKCCTDLPVWQAEWLRRWSLLSSRDGKMLQPPINIELAQGPMTCTGWHWPFWKGKWKCVSWRLGERARERRGGGGIRLQGSVHLVEMQRGQVCYIWWFLYSPGEWM